METLKWQVLKSSEVITFCIINLLLGVIDTEELIFGVIFMIQGHWEAQESKITKIQNCSLVAINIDPRGYQPQGTHF